jgi:hypothetical protein
MANKREQLTRYPRASDPQRYVQKGGKMNGREELLRRVALKCADFARQLSYHRALAKYQDEFRQSFWIYMYNNAIDLAVLDWFHLFGYHTDDLHWKQVILDIPAFRKALYQFFQKTEGEWKTYRDSIKDYRDKDVAHIEVRPISHVPDMTAALKAASFYYSKVLDELSILGDYTAWPRDLEEYHTRSLKQTKEILGVAYQASQNMEERVF